MLTQDDLGIAPPQLQALFPKLGRVDEPLARHRLRFWRPLHTRQLATQASFASSNVLQRSPFGLVHCYNRLLQRLVDASSVKVFQRKLQQGLLQHAEQGAAIWQQLFSTNWKRIPRTKLDDLFP